VFSNGIIIGLKAMIPVGGHLVPISGVGDSLEWKNAQKNDKKNITSDKINRIIPHRILIITLIVWWPCWALSRETSRHHWKVINIIVKIPRIIKLILEA